MATVRTPEELNSPIYNYYIAFNIDPAEQNAEKIVLSIKRRLSSATSGSVFVRRLVELRVDIIEVMVRDSVYDADTDTYVENSGGRARELMRAKTFKLDLAAELINDAIRMNKALPESRIDAIYSALNSGGVFFTKEELYSAARCTEGQYAKSQASAAGEEEIPFSQYEKANEYLYALGFNNLFEALSSTGVEITAESTPVDIDNAKAALYVFGMKTTDMRIKMSISNLGAVIGTVLVKTPGGVRSYSDYLAAKDAVWDKLKIRRDVGLSEMSLDEYLYFVAELVRILGISVAEAHAMLKVGAKYYRVSLSETKFN